MPLPEVALTLTLALHLSPTLTLALSSAPNPNLTLTLTRPDVGVCCNLSIYLSSCKFGHENSGTIRAQRHEPRPR